MKSFLTKLSLISALLGIAPAGWAFSLLGPYKAYQVAGIGYRLTGDIGGPMNRSEGYRWNVPVITYAFDKSFINYFGSNGVAAVEKAIRILNDLPPASQITNDGANLYIAGEIVPTETKLIHYEALGLSMLDLKSHALQLLVEEMGLAEPERWAWALRDRSTPTIGGVQVTNYAIIQLNFDWLTLRPTNQVNGAYYGFDVVEPITPGNYADAIEQDIAPTPSVGVTFSSVAGKVLGAGEFYFGLTRDDVAGLKFLYSSNNYAAETLLPTVSRDVNFKTSPWIPVIGIGVTNGTGTNVVGGTNAGVVVQALRGGVEKIQFQRVNFDSLLSQNFRPITNRYKDFIITNLSNGKVKWAVQRVQRAILQPDILFTAEPLGVDQFSEPFIAIRTDTAAWLNNDAIDGSTGQGGPGVIPPQVRIAFTDEFPISLGTAPDQVSDGTVFPGVVWGSFDETDAPPIIYPVNPQLTLEELQAILNGGSGN